MRPLIPLVVQDLRSVDVHELDRHAVDVADPVVVLRPVRVADPGGVGPGLAEDADLQFLGHVGLDREFGSDAAVLLGVLTPSNGSAVLVEDDVTDPRDIGDIVRLARRDFFFGVDGLRL